MSAIFNRLGQSELFPRYIFIEGLYARRRVLEVGAIATTDGESAQFLISHGARLVVAIDDDMEAVERAKRTLEEGPQLRFRHNALEDLEANAFDFIAVADFSPYVRAPELMKPLLRLLAPSGFLMGGLRTPAGFTLSAIMAGESEDAPPTYGQLLDVLRAHFTSIEMATQSPVLAYQLAFENGEGLQVDASLAGSPEAAYYVVLAGSRPIRAVDPTWVQLPPEPLAFVRSKLERAEQNSRNWCERTEQLQEDLALKAAEATTQEAAFQKAQQQLEESQINQAQLQENLALKAAEATAQEAAFQKAQRQLEESQTNQAQLQEDLALKAAEATAQEAAFQKAQQQLEALEQLKVDLLSEREEQTRDYEVLTARVRELEAELATAHERMHETETRCTSTYDELHASLQAHKDASHIAWCAQEEARLERTRHEEIAVELENVRAHLLQEQQQLREVQSTIEEERSAREQDAMSLENAHAESLKTVGRLETELQKAHAETAEAKNHIQETQAHEANARTRINAQLKARQEEIESMQARLQWNQAALEDALAFQKLLQQALSKAQEQSSGEKTELEQLRETYAATLQQVDMLKSQIPIEKQRLLEESARPPPPTHPSIQALVDEKFEFMMGNVEDSEDNP